MRVIVVGTEHGLFKPGSAARERIAQYGSLVEDMHIIVLTGRGTLFRDTQIAPNVFVHPTRSWCKLLSIRDAVRVGRRLAHTLSGTPPADARTLVSAQDPFESGVVASRIAPFFHAKLHLQVHTDIFSPHFAKSKLNRVRLAFASRLLPAADAVRVVSASLKERLAASNLVPAERISVLPIYVSPRELQEIDTADPDIDIRTTFPDFKFVAVMASRFAPEKDIETALTAVSLLKEHGSHFGLVIAGEGPEEGKLKSLAAKLHIADRVRFLPWQRHLHSLFRSANVFLLTSSFEGYGMALIEAALSGVPIISTKVGVATEFKDGVEALLCDVGDAECIAYKLRLLIEDHALRQSLKTNGRLAAARLALSKDDYLRGYRASYELAFLSPKAENGGHVQ